MPYTDYNWIDQRLAVGGRIEEYADLPFDAIVCLQTEGAQDEHRLPGAAELGDVVYQWLPMTDGPTDGCLEHFGQVAALIEAWHSQDKRVLVHCWAGVSRSVSAVVYYLMRTQGLSYAAALERVRQARPQAHPNPGFEVALRRRHGEELDNATLHALAEGWRTLLRESYGVEDDEERIWRDMGGPLPGPTSG